MKKVVITGPTGTIGLALIKKLLFENIEVLAICRRNSPGIENIPKSKLVKVIECDISEYFKLNISEKYDVFYHFAWEGTIGESRNNVYIQSNNVKHTLDAIQLAHKLGCKKFVGAGSQAEYGRLNKKITLNTNTNPLTGYGIAKLSAGKMGEIMCSQLGIMFNWVRVLSVYGPNDDQNTMIISTINKLLDGESANFTSGNQIWDYLYCDDAAEGFYLIGLKGKNKKIYCLANGNCKPLKEFIYILRDAIDPNLEVNLGVLSNSETQTLHLCADISELNKDCSYIPKVSFKEGITKTIAHVVKQRNSSGG